MEDGNKNLWLKKNTIYAKNLPDFSMLSMVDIDILLSSPFIMTNLLHTKDKENLSKSEAFLKTDLL